MHELPFVPAQKLGGHLLLLQRILTCEPVNHLVGRHGLVGLPPAGEERRQIGAARLQQLLKT